MPDVNPKEERSAGEERLPTILKVEPFPRSKEGYASLKIYNGGHQRVRCYAYLTKLLCVDNPDMKLDIKDSVNPGQARLSWHGGSPKGERDIDFRSSETLNIACQDENGIKFTLQDNNHKAHGQNFEIEVEIRADSDDASIPSVTKWKGCVGLSPMINIRECFSTVDEQAKWSTSSSKTPINSSPANKSAVIGGIMVFLFVIGAIADVFGAWTGIRQLFSNQHIPVNAPIGGENRLDERTTPVVNGDTGRAPLLELTTVFLRESCPRQYVIPDEIVPYNNMLLPDNFVEWNLAPNEKGKLQILVKTINLTDNDIILSRVMTIRNSLISNLQKHLNIVRDNQCEVNLSDYVFAHKAFQPGLPQQMSLPARINDISLKQYESIDLLINLPCQSPGIYSLTFDLSFSSITRSGYFQPNNEIIYICPETFALWKTIGGQKIELEYLYQWSGLSYEKR